MGDVELKSEWDNTIELTLTRVDQRIIHTPILYSRPGDETLIAKPEHGKRQGLFILTGKATQAEKSAIEDASRSWWTQGAGTTQGRIRFKWGDNKGDGEEAGTYYSCVLGKVDFWKEGKAEKYDFLIELIESDFPIS